jgi:membrane associated rhomboid family serine protease
MGFLQKQFSRKYYNATLVLIVINAAVFAVQRFFPDTTLYLAMNPFLITRGHFFWQFVTYMFAHGNFSHIFFNMFALFIFGSAIEKRMGSIEFLLYYFITGIGAGVFSFIVFLIFGQNTFLLGASGALFAVQLCYATILPDAVVYVWGILPLRAPVMVLVFTAIEMFSALTGANAGVAHLTHLAGFAFGWLYFLVRFRYNPWRSLGRRHH